MKIPILKTGDSIDIVAPASRCSDQHLKDIHALLQNWQLKCNISEDIFGADLLCANTDEIRLKELKNALENTNSKAIICARGGYGSMRLIPELAKINQPTHCKLFIGMSDITALNLFFQQQWQWPTLHAAASLDKFSSTSINLLKKILFGEIQEWTLTGEPFNIKAQENHHIESTITGGNLSIVQASLGTLWQIDARNKIIFLEEVGERAYRIDRMLEHLHQAKVFQDAKAIIFGDFLLGHEPDGSSLIEPVLKRFAESSEIPVVYIPGLGHGENNTPLPLGIPARLELGQEVRLLIRR